MKIQRLTRIKLLKLFFSASCYIRITAPTKDDCVDVSSVTVMVINRHFEIARSH